MNWEDIRLFLVVARAGSFTRAADQSQQSAVTLSRRVSAMETALGTKLFLRGTKGVVLTDHGAALLVKTAPVEATMQDAIAAARSLKTSGWSSPIRITGTEPVIAEMVAPHIHTLVDDHPDLKIELKVSNEIVSLSAFSAEIALRLAKPAGNSLKVQRLTDLRFSLYATKDYTQPLNTAQFLGYDDTYGDIPEVVWMRDQGFADRMRLRSSSTRALLQAARAGLGIVLLPIVIGSKYPELVPIPCRPEVQRRSLWMLTHPDLAKVAEIRAVSHWLRRVLN